MDPSGDEAPNIEILPLDEESLEALRTSFMMFIAIAEENGLGDEEAQTPEICDAMVRWWHAQSDDERPGSDELIWMIGTAAGDYLRYPLRLEWCRLVQDGETSLGLVGEREEGPLVISIFDAVAGRLPGGADGFVIDLMMGIGEVTTDLRRSDDDPGPEPLLEFGDGEGDTDSRGTGST